MKTIKQTGRTATKCGVVVMATALAVPTFGATFVGQDNTGTGNVNEPTHWSPQAVPTDSDISFTQGGTVSGGGAETFSVKKITASFAKGNDLYLRLGSQALAASGDYSTFANGGRTIIDGSTVSFYRFHVGEDGNPGSTLVLTNGAQVSTSQRWNVGWGSVGDNTFIVTGKGTSFSHDGGTWVLIGNTTSNNRVLIDDGATLASKAGFVVGQGGNNKAGTNNCLVVKNGAKATLDAYITVGRANVTSDAYSHDCNWVLVADSGVLSLGGALNVGGNRFSNSNRVEVTGRGVMTANGTFVGESGTAVNSKWMPSSYNELIVSDGGVYTNTAANPVYLGYRYDSGSDLRSVGNRIWVGTNATFVTLKEIVVGVNGRDNSVEFDSAKNVELKDVFINHLAGSASNNTMIVRNVDKFSAGDIVVGEEEAGARLVISNVNAFTCGQIVAGNKAGPSHVELYDLPASYVPDIRVGKEATAAGSSCIYSGPVNPDGSNAQSFNKTFFDGIIFGSSTTSGTIDVRHVDWTCEGSWSFTAENYPGRRYVIGAGSRFVTKTVYTSRIGGEPGTHLTVDGGVFDTGAASPALNIGTEGSGGITLEICNGGTVYATNGTCAVGYTGGGQNTVIVSSGSTFKAKRLRLNNSNNTLIISNATVWATDEISIPSSDALSVAYVTNTLVRFEGASPRLVSDGTLQAYSGKSGSYVCTDTAYSFAVPAAGYAQPPIEGAKDVDLHSGLKILADVDDYRLAGGGTLVLARAGDGFKVKVDDWDTLCSELPSRTQLFLSDDQRELRLKVRPPVHGLVIIIN